MDDKLEDQDQSNSEKKTTSEKPVSLAPLGFMEALAGLLQVKPKPKEDDQGQEEAEESSED